MVMKLITIKEATKISGKSPQTLKRWVEQKIIKKHKREAYHNAPILIDELELKAHLSRLTPSLKEHDMTLIESLNHQIELLKNNLEDIKTERNFLRSEVHQLKSELADARKKIDALNVELIGRTGVKGLLKAIFR